MPLLCGAAVSADGDAEAGIVSADEGKYDMVRLLGSGFRIFACSLQQARVHKPRRERGGGGWS